MYPLWNIVFKWKKNHKHGDGANLSEEGTSTCNINIVWSITRSMSRKRSLLAMLCHKKFPPCFMSSRNTFLCSSRNVNNPCVLGAVSRRMTTFFFTYPAVLSDHKNDWISRGADKSLARTTSLSIVSFFSPGNRWYSYGARSGEYGGWSRHWKPK
jgi:hypothetical protein